MTVKFETFVTHSFIAVFTDTEENGMNDWTPAHSSQGFSWRPGSVSFATAGDAGDLSIEVEWDEELNFRENGQRVIQVPFDADTDEVVLADVLMHHKVSVPRGKYSLVFQHGWHDSEAFPGELDMWCVLSFVTDANAQPRILKADEDIEVPQAFLMEARMA